MNNPRHNRTVTSILCIAAVSVGSALGLLGALPAAAGAATPAPRFAITSAVTPANLIPGDTTGIGTYAITVVNTGGAPTSGPITITDTLPAGVTVHSGVSPSGFSIFQIEDDGSNITSCSVGPPVTCPYNGSVPPGSQLNVFIPVDVAGNVPSLVTNHASVSGGGVASVSTAEDTPVSLFPAAAGFRYFSSALRAADGATETQAGAHPYSLNVNFQLNTVNPPEVTGVNSPVETPKRVSVDLPQGVVVNPQATEARCTESQLQSDISCPDASAVGIVHSTVGIYGFGNSHEASPLYSMVTPPGTPAVFGFNAAGFGIFAHIVGGVSSDNGYALSAGADNILEYGNISGLSVDLWGDLSDPSHDHRRGRCGTAFGFGIQGGCPVDSTPTPFLTMPSACSGPLATKITVASWQHPDDPISTTSESTDADGDPAGVDGCAALDFKPTLKARPTTTAADSPSGLDVDLGVPQTNSFDTRATSTLKKAVVTLPEGLVLNPSAGNGLGACSSVQAGLTSPIGQTPIRFDENHASCPESAKIGSAEVDSPLVPDPLPGSVYIAKPFDNPFDSFLAIYIVVDDPVTGVVIKLAGHVEADPDSGQLVTTFDDNPQLPFSDFKLNFKSGPHGVLRTPSTCGNFSTTSALSPWSGNAAETPHDDYAIDQSPTGACVSSEDQQPNSPAFDAGTVSPLAGAFTPFVLNLTRNDATQQFSKVTVSPPPGLVGKLAGTPACADAAIDGASSKSGQDEPANPSCPAASQVGVVDVAAGSGPDPYNTQAKVYMAGPYKGAPLSLAIIAPATAGPFDLGTVVVRTALTIDPTTAQITATSRSPADDPAGHPARHPLGKAEARQAELHPERHQLQPQVGDRAARSRSSTRPPSSPTPSSSPSAAVSASSRASPCACRVGTSETAIRL